MISLLCSLLAACIQAQSPDSEKLPAKDSSTAEGEWHQRAESIMGTRVQAELWHTDSRQANALLDEVMAEMARIDQTYSPYIETSELSRLNQRGAKQAVKVSAEMLLLLQRSQQMSELSEGAFDITYASVGRYYNYREASKPDADTLMRVVEAINYEYVEINTQAHLVRFRHPQVYVDLGGIAKGYAVDQAVQILLDNGISQASVSAGGDSRIVGDRRGQPWTVGIKHPRKPDEMAAILPLTDTAVSTSGDYERFFEADGVRYHHILDPQTGDSARNVRSVTILGPQAVLTDALSTSVFVLGSKAGLELIDKLPGIDAIIIDSSGKMLFSADLSELSP